jgi:hypothetical protein
MLLQFRYLAKLKTSRFKTFANGPFEIISQRAFSLWHHSKSIASIKKLASRNFIVDDGLAKCKYKSIEEQMKDK